MKKLRMMTVLTMSTVMFYIVMLGKTEITVSESPIVISEVCAKNDWVAYDENGNYGADYIELFNKSDLPVFIGGYGISDDSQQLYKFIIPETTIPANGTIVLWNNVSNEDLSLRDEDYIPTDIHGVTFGLANGEILYLTDSKGTIVDKVVLPTELPENAVYQTTLDDLGVYYVGGESLYYVEKTATEEKEESYMLKEPAFSVLGGWFEEELYLELTCDDGDIYYTLDGSEPDVSSLKYAGPILISNRSKDDNVFAMIEGISPTHKYLPDENIDKGTVVKAIAINGEKKSRVSSESFFVGLCENDGYEDVSIVSITVDPKDFFDYYHGIYVEGFVMDSYMERTNSELLDTNSYLSIYANNANYAKEGRGWERPAKIEYFSVDHEKVFEQKVGIRIHGSYSTSLNQKSFNLYARPEYDGNDVFLYDFWGKSYNKLMLRTGGFKDAQVTKFRDVLNQSLVSDRELGVQCAEPCIVFLNGEYWGLYNLQEIVGVDYIEQHYGVDQESAIVLKNPMEDGENEPADAQLYRNIVAFASVNDLSVDKNYKEIEEKIDIQSYIDYYSFQIYVANCDSIVNNYALWRSRQITTEPYNDGKWRFLLLDTDQSVGIKSSLTEPEVDSFLGGHYETNPMGEGGDALFSALIRNEEFKRRFTVTFMDMVNHNFDYDRIKEKISWISELYEDSVIESHKRFLGEYSEDRYEKDVAVVYDFFERRAEYITEHMKNALELKGELMNLKVVADPDCTEEIKINSLIFEKDQWKGTWEGDYFTDYSIELECCPSDGYRLAGWKVNGEIVSDELTLTLELQDKTAVVEALLESIL